MHTRLAVQIQAFGRIFGDSSNLSNRNILIAGIPWIIDFGFCGHSILYRGVIGLGQSNSLKHNIPLFIHKIVRDKRGSDNVQDSVRPHRRHLQHINMGYKHNRNTNIVKNQMDIHVY